MPVSAGPPGYSLLEVQVAFAILGIGLAGLCPLVVMQLRQVRLLELRLQGHVIETQTGQTMLASQDLLYRAVAEPLDAEAGRYRPDPGCRPPTPAIPAHSLFPRRHPPPIP